MDRKIDHLVYAVFNLDEAMDHFEQMLSVRPVFGGYHGTQGTKNALINLDRGRYLEILAIDNDNNGARSPRWMGIDVLTRPQITRWALQTTDLLCDSNIVKQHHPEMGCIKSGTRTTAHGRLLQWKMSMPLAKPEVELLPFMVDWSRSDTHPHDDLPDMGCKLIDISATHPRPEQMYPVLQKFGIAFHIRKSDSIAIKVVLDTPNGTIEI